MRRSVIAFLLALFLLPPLAHATPQLFVYEGAGCTGSAALPAFEAFAGRPVDGVVDFNDYTQTPTNAVSNLNWQLGCWQGAKVPNVAISIGLAFNGMSTAQIAVGGMDAQFASMAKSLVSHGYQNAYIRLGWEMNGGWYGWGQKGAGYVTAYNHVAPILKANCPSCTIVFNPAMGADPSSEFPGTANIGAMGLDVYATSWLGNVQTEPGLWNANLTGYWGVDMIGGWYQGLGYVVPEFGVGSRGDGHGTCSGTTASACDDGTYMTNALAYFDQMNVKFVGMWDYNAGDYNSKISDGSRYNEGVAFLKEFGTPAAQAAFAAKYGPVVLAPAAPAKANFTIYGDQGSTATVAPNADGSGVVTLHFPTTAKPVNYTFYIQANPAVPWTYINRNVGPVGGAPWGEMHTIAWNDQTGGTAQVLVGAK